MLYNYQRTDSFDKIIYLNYSIQLKCIHYIIMKYYIDTPNCIASQFNGNGNEQQHCTSSYVPYYPLYLSNVLLEPFLYYSNHVCF